MEYIQAQLEDDPMVDLQRKINCWSIECDHIDDNVNALKEVIESTSKCHLIDLAKTEDGKECRVICYEWTPCRAIIAGNFAITEDKIKLVDKNPEENAKVARFVKGIKNGEHLKRGTHLFQVSR